VSRILGGSYFRDLQRLSLAQNCVHDRGRIFSGGRCERVWQFSRPIGEDLRPTPLNRRLADLIGILSGPENPHIVEIATAYSTADKQRLHDQLKAANKEGVVLKRLDAPYSAGRANTGGRALKHKFTATLSAVVSMINVKRSVEFRLLSRDGWRIAGNVTIPANQPVPETDEVIELRYLYAFPESGVLFQPVYLGVRCDVEQTECVTSQLKFKPTEDDES